MSVLDFLQITEVRLAEGAHVAPEQGMCFMEMVAWFAGEKHSDKPACACPVLGAYGICLNDGMPDVERDRLLKPVVPMIAGTRSPADELARARFLAMWTVNKIYPVWLRVYGVAELDALATECERAETVDDLQRLAALAARAARAARADLAALAARARDQIYPIAVEGLKQAILIGRHEGFDLAIDLAARREALKQLVDA